MSDDAVGGDRQPWFRTADAALLVAVIAVAAVALLQSWNRWLDPIVDSGRDLYIPEQLRHGAKLYRDIVYFYPPLTPYLLAAVTALVGSSLVSYTAIGIAIAALTALALYVSGRVLGNPVAGGAAAMLFAACSIATPWSRGGNYLFPYAHAAILAMLFFVSFGCFLLAYLFVDRRPSFLIAALIAALAASWTKVEFAIFTSVLLVVFAIVHRIAARWLAGYAAVFAGSIAFVSWTFRDAPPDRTWLRGNVLPDAMLGSRSLAGFYANVGGLGQWPLLLGASAIGAAIFCGIVLMLRFAKGRWRLPLAVLAALAAIVFGASQLFFRAWTVLELVAIVVALRRPREPLLVVAALALCASSRIAFNVTPQWYGFVLCVPVYLLMAYAVFEWLPARGLYSRSMALLWLLAFGAAAVQWMASAHLVYAARTHPIVSERGVLYDDNADRAAILNEASRVLKQRAIRSIAFFPEGLTLNYLFGTPTRLAYYTFTPAETGTPVGEANALADLTAKRPESIAIVARDVREFGARGFGVDYDLRLASAIRSQYALERRWSSERFEFLLLRRRTSAASSAGHP